MVPIIAPILLAETGANVTAVWLGVMIGVNMQTSFLTPPFGFSLFYLRGVAPPSVSTIQIWKGAIAFIFLQLIGLAIVGYYPSMVNYLPNRTYLTSDVAPPPLNPRLQECIQEYKFNLYSEKGDSIRKSINSISSIDINYLPDEKKEIIVQNFEKALLTFDLVENLKQEEKQLAFYSQDYKSLHQKVRKIQKSIFKNEKRIKQLYKDIRYLEEDDILEDKIKIERKIEIIELENITLQNKIPTNWDVDHNKYKELANNRKGAQTKYKRNVDEVYKNIKYFKLMIKDLTELTKLEDQINSLGTKDEISLDQAMLNMKDVEKNLDKIAGTELIKDKITKSRRILKKNDPDMSKVLSLLNEAKNIFVVEKEWRKRAQSDLLTQLNNFDNSIISLNLNEFKNNIKKINEKNEQVTENQMSNMSNKMSNRSVKCLICRVKRLICRATCLVAVLFFSCRRVLLL